jgi:hypothetical protein
MLNLSLLDPQNYAHVGSYIVPVGKDLILPQRVELSDTMMIRWTINHLAKDVDFLQLGSGLLISEIEIMGYGIIESATFDIPPSNFQTKRVQLINLDLQVPQKLTFRSPSTSILNSVLEFYAYTGEEEQVYNTYHTDYMPSNNPVNINTGDLTTAFSAALASNTATQAQATAAAINNSTKTGNTIPSNATAKPWTGNILDHKIIDPKALRLETHLMHTGKNGSANSNSTVFLVVGDPTGKDINKFDHILTPLGDWTSSNEEDVLPVYAWVEPNKTPVTLSNYEVMPLTTTATP